MLRADHVVQVEAQGSPTLYPRLTLYYYRTATTAVATSARNFAAVGARP
jgi:hypothetical protein